MVRFVDITDTANISKQGEQSMNYEEANDIVLKSDLEQILHQKGLSLKHIASLKSRRPDHLNDYYTYYDHISNNDKKEILVEPQKIVGIDRANKNASFFDNATGRCNTELNVYNMATAIEHISNDTLEQLYTWYKNLYNPVALIYFSDEDVYDVGRDGNHRSLYANIIGAPLIKADVDYYMRDEEKYNAYLNYKKLCSDYALLSVQLNDNGVSEATFLYNNKEYTVAGYAYPFKDMQCSKEQIAELAEQLNYDFKHLKFDWLISFLGKHLQARKLYLKFVLKDSIQARRLHQHIIQRNNIDYVK